MVRRLNLDGGDQTGGMPTMAPPVAPPAMPTMAPPIAPPVPSFATPATIPAAPPTFAKEASVPAAPRPKPPIALEAISDVGNEAQSNLSTVTNRLAQESKLSDMDEMGVLLQNTMLAAKGYDPQNLLKSGIFGFFKAKKDQLAMKFDSVDGIVNKLVAQVEQKAAREKQRASEMASMRETNEQYANALKPQFEYLYQVADWMEANKPVAIDGDMESAQYLNDWNTVINFARVRADNLERAKVFAHQQSAIMGGMRQNAINLSATLTELKNTSIPTLKTSFILYIQNMEMKKNADFADKVNAVTNEAARKNAELHGQNSEQIARSVNRSNYEMSTLQANYDSVVKSLDTAARINAEEAQRRKTELPQILKLGEDLSKRLAQPNAA